MYEEFCLLRIHAELCLNGYLYFMYHTYIQGNCSLHAVLLMIHTHVCLNGTTAGQGYGSGLPQTLPAQPSLGPMQGMGYVPSAIGTLTACTKRPVFTNQCLDLNLRIKNIL